MGVLPLLLTLERRFRSWGEGLDCSEISSQWPASWGLDPIDDEFWSILSHNLGIFNNVLEQQPK